ncbi:MAG TPA: carboxypeptidase regulatory-like domain-containing protein [Candidatus Acidoferrales bacterium]|nr:carboxypeptidase regulatory-like domain-containing protein [Candidatus Acidoferrales bacterium]
MNWKRFLVAVFAALLFLPSISMAQSITTGAIGGTVTDPSGAVIVGANLTLTNPGTGEALTTITGATGGFQFTLLQPGTYTLAVTQSGFKQSSESVEVHLGQISTVNLKMEVGAGSVTVEVTGQGALLQTEDANISTNFDTRQVENVPNPGGDITNIAQTAPGVTMNTTGDGFGNFSAFGLPATANLFTINGNDYNDPFLNLNNSGSSNLLLGGNELQEVAVVVNGYTGQYGRQAGAQIDYTTKGGSNSFHGDVVYNWTGRALNANDFFNNLGDLPRPFSNNNQWAASLGGPIKKDKLFFFANTEGLRYILPTSTRVFTPTTAYENYILSQAPIASSPTVTAFYNNAFSLYNATTARNPQAAPQLGSCGASSGFPAFSGDPTGVNTACLNEFQESGANQNKEWLLDGRVDYVMSDKDKLFARVKVDRGSQPTYTDPISPTFNALSIQPEDDGQLNYTHVFSPNVVNSFVGSVLYYRAIFENANQTAALGLFPGILTLNDSSLTPLGTTSGDFPFAFFFPQGRAVTQYQLVDDVSVTHGRNAFKMGVNFRRVDWSDHTAAQNTFYPGLSVPSLAFEQNEVDVLVGTPPNQTRSGTLVQNFAVSPEQPLSNYSFGLYFQDQLRVSSRLTLTLTLRVDRNSPGGCSSGCATRLSSPFDAMPHAVNVPFDQNFLSGFHQILPNVEKIVPEPRFGFAWTPFGDKTVFRGGVGLFTDLYPVAILNAYTTNFPQVNRFTIPAGTLAFTNPAAAGDTATGAGLAATCNAAFASTYAAGGTLADYQTASHGQCVDANNNPLVANFNDPNNNAQNPKFIEWNFEVQRSIGNHTVFSANYVGNRGYDIFLFNPYLNAFDTAGFGGLPTAATDARVAEVTQLTNNGYSNYNGLTLSLQQNAWHGFSGRINYSYSHALDNISNGGSIEPYSAFSNVSITEQINPFNPKAQYGNADYDIRHYVSGSYVYELPFKSESRLVNAAIGGWMISGTVYYHTGLPFTLVDGITAGGLAPENNNNVTVLPQAIAPIPSSCNHSAVATPCFTNADFASTPSGFITNVGRNSIRGPGYFNTDFSIRKNFKLNERFNFQVGANAYNVLNHVNFQAPVGNTADGPGVFGQIISTVTPPTSVFGAFANGNADARVLQIQGKLTF